MKRLDLIESYKFPFHWFCKPIIVVFNIFIDLCAEVIHCFEITVFDDMPL